MDVQIDKLKRMREKEELKDSYLKTIASKMKVKEQNTLIDKQIDFALEDGPKEIVKMNEYQEMMVKKAKEQKFKDD